MFTYQFWRLAFERAVKTFAQTLAALFGASGIGLLDAPWGAALSAAGMAAVLSVLTSMGSEPLGERHNPSLLATPHLAPTPSLVTAVPGTSPATEQPAPATEQPAQTAVSA